MQLRSAVTVLPPARRSQSLMSRADESFAQLVQIPG